MPKKVNALVPEVREQECENHHFSFRGVVPGTGRCICSMCNTELKGYKVKQATIKMWINGQQATLWIDNNCKICGKLRVEPDPLIEGPVTEPFPEWACFEVFCGDMSTSEGERNAPRPASCYRQVFHT